MAREDNCDFSRSDMFDAEGHLDYSRVRTDNPTGMIEKIREAHPRICVNDWGKIREKIKTDYWCKRWFESAKSACDGYLEKDVIIDYKLNERNNLNNTSLDLKIKLICLGFVGAVTQDKRYVKKAYQLLKHAHDTWPDYGESIALISENVIFAFALGYDWLYDEFTEEQRKDVLDMIIDRCVYIAVEGYEHVLNEAYDTLLIYGNNQTCGANTSNILTAIAIATDKPDIAEYLFEKGSKGMPNVFSEISKDGAYIETCEYWAYGVTYLMGTISALETCIKDGESLPECLDWANTEGFDKTGDFPIYYTGVFPFNYGDSTLNFITSATYMYLSARYKKPKYAWYEINRTQVHGVFTLRRAPFAVCWYDPDYSVCKPGEFELDKFYSSEDARGINGMSVRSSWENDGMLFAAMQGGDNSVMHMRPSLGTFVLDYAGKRWFLLTGKDGAVSTYTIDMHYDGNIYDLWHQRTESNNTLVINPDLSRGQNDNAVSVLEKYDSDENSAYGIFDIRNARDGVISWKRGMMIFDNRTRIKIRDELKCEKPSEVYWLGHTYADITLDDDKMGAYLKIDDDVIYARLNDAPKGCTLGVRERSPLPESPNPEYQKDKYLAKFSGDKTLYVHIENAKEANIEVEFITIKKGETAPSDKLPCSLDLWKCEGGRAFVEQEIGNATALKIDSPLAFARGKKCFISDSKKAAPYMKNGAALVPVSFIADSFISDIEETGGGKTLDIHFRDRHIVISDNCDYLTLNGEKIKLSVPSETFGGMLFAPLNELSKALGKKIVFDNGLIIISDVDMNYGNEALSDACKYLDIRVFAGGDEIEFSPSKTVYYVSGAKRDITFTKNHFTGSVEKKDDTTIVIDGTEYKFIFEN